MNGDKDNGNSMDSISNGHDETSNGDDVEATSDGAIEISESSTPMVSEPTSPQRSSNKRKEPQVVRIDEEMMIHRTLRMWRMKIWKKRKN